eukprot:3591586-Pyramimonas_sp.AAC.1
MGSSCVMCSSLGPWKLSAAHERIPRWNTTSVSPSGVVSIPPTCPIPSGWMRCVPTAGMVTLMLPSAAGLGKVCGAASGSTGFTREC